MAVQNSNDFPLNSSESVIHPTDIGVDRLTQARIKIRIPKNLHAEPVLSRLVSQYNITINIHAALLSANARDDGWFDLELRGTTPQIQNGLTYLNELDLEIWSQSTSEEDGW